jgi:imidazolonepropionase-like amidohydrolase
MTLIKKVKYILASQVCLVLLSTTAVAQTKTLFKDVRVFDGLNLLPSTNVLVIGERIAQMGHTIEVPPGTDIIDGTGKTLLPGLIDAHAHVYGTALEDAIEAGVTTVLDMFADPKMAANVRREQEVGRMLDRADLYSAGILVTAPGGHGTEYGIPIPTLSSPDSAQAFVDARLAEGSDYIKIVSDNGTIFGMHIPTLNRATIKAVIEATHKRGRLAVIHIGSLQEAREAIELGVDGLMHAPSDVVPDKEFVQLAREHGVFVCPTLSVILSATGGSNASIASDPHVAMYATEANVTNLQKSFPHSPNATANYNAAAAAVKMLQLAHVLILAGSDAPNPGTAHGISIHREMELLVQAGLTPVHALAAATGNPADAFHLRERGHICVGCRADLLLVNGDPTVDIKATRDIVGVWKLGHKLDRAPYLAKVAKERFDKQVATSLPASSVGTGAISDFEDGTTKTRFGAGWSLSVDANVVGGNSDAVDAIVIGGANGSKKSLLVKGTIRNKFQYPWAGVMFSPGAATMQPANLSSKHALHFWAKGDGGTYRVMLYTKHGGYMPSIEQIEIPTVWKEYTMPFAGFNGVDGSDVLSFVFCGGPATGPFEFQLDEVGLQ